jgi:DNA-binding NarL/FixJ family response regulator
MTGRPLLLVRSDGLFERELTTAAAAGWLIHSGWDWDSPGRIVCAGQIASPDDAEAALLAAVRGAGVIARVDHDLELVERLYEDLSRIGRVEVRDAGNDLLATLTAEERRLLEMLADGHCVGAAARNLYVSRRTADRRLHSARLKLGVSTTVEAVLAVQASSESVFHH